MCTRRQRPADAHLAVLGVCAARYERPGAGRCSRVLRVCVHVCARVCCMRLTPARGRRRGEDHEGDERYVAERDGGGEVRVVLLVVQDARHRHQHHERQQQRAQQLDRCSLPQRHVREQLQLEGRLVQPPRADAALGPHSAQHGGGRAEEGQEGGGGGGAGREHDDVGLGVVAEDAAGEGATR